MCVWPEHEPRHKHGECFHFQRLLVSKQRNHLQFALVDCRCVQQYKIKSVEVLNELRTGEFVLGFDILGRSLRVDGVVLSQLHAEAVPCDLHNNHEDDRNQLR
jgi:hypothetical protein